MGRMEKEKRKEALKISIACITAILIADVLHLQYFVTAGIITILTIQDTKKETLKTAARRGMAFFCAILIAAGCFALLGYRLSAFCLFIFLFILLCMVFSWPEAMSMGSVLISHFFIEQSMSAGWLYNEAMLFLIGTSSGIFVNMLLLGHKETEFKELSRAVDEEMRGILERMAGHLGEEDRSEYENTCFMALKEKLEAARNCAARNYNNSIFGSSTYELEYVEMRQKQGMELEDIYRSIGMIQTLPAQAAFVADYIGRIVREYHRENDVQELLDELEQILEGMKQEDMPKSREEFEARAVLFYLLKQLEEFLKLKNEFVRHNRRN